MPSFVKEMKNKIESILLSAKGNDDNLPILDTYLLNELVSFSQIGKNIDDDDEIQSSFIDYKYYFDFKDLLKNKNIWVKSQNHRDILLQIISRIDNIKIKNKDRRDFENFIIELFNTSKYDTEKAQLANIIYNNVDIKDDIFLKEITKFCVSVENDKKKLFFSLRTNGFFSDRTINTSYNEMQRKKKNIYSVIVDNIDSSLAEQVKKLFFSEEKDKIDDLQLKKVKIYLLLKAINSNLYKDSTDINKKQIINDILSKSYSSFNANLINSFCCECSFGATLFFNEKDKKNIFNIEAQDIINNLDDNIGEVKKQKIDDIFENVSFDDIDFFELKGIDDANNEYFYFKNSLDAEGKSKLLICFNSNQKRELLSAIYSHKSIYTKIANLSNQKSTCVDIFDFAKICLKVSSDPMPANNYKDVYNKYYLHEEDKVLGGLATNANFSVKIDSNENFIRNDYTDCIITTEILLEWLKLQAKSIKPLHEMKVVISDIENLPIMLEEYNDFIINQNEKSSKNLTLVDNLVIKNSNILSIDQMASLISRLNDTKTCFKSLKIDDKNIADYAKYVESTDGIKNSYNILYGGNDNFYSIENIEKQKHKKNIINNGNKNSDAFSELEKKNDEKISLSDLSECLIKVDVAENIDRFKSSLEKMSTKKANDNEDIDVNIAVDVDIDMDIEFMLNLNKEPPLIEDLNENDCITYDNVDNKMNELLEPNNNRFSNEMKVFLLFLKEKNKDSFKDIFQKITNRESLSDVYKEREFKNSNYRLTPEAFVHLLREYLCFGATKWNGSFGDPELSIFQIKEDNGAKKFVVAKTIKNINYGYINPIEEMFTFIPTNTVSIDDSSLETKYGVQSVNINNDIRTLDNYIIGSRLGDNIRNVFLLNPCQSGFEYRKYISDNKDEILDFLQILKNDSKYRRICSTVCSNFCKQQNISNIKQKFSLINPVNFLRGMKKVFDLLHDLKKNSFIDDNFIEQLPSVLGENKYAIQTVYIMLLKKKLDVERLIIAYRNNNLKTKISVDINDSKEVEKYFKDEKNIIGNYHNNQKLNNFEKNFSNFSFNGILNYKNVLSSSNEKVFNYGNDVIDVDDVLESGGIFFRNNLTKQQISCNFTIANDKLEDIKYSSEKGGELYPKYLELCYFLNKKRNRAADGTIEESQLTDQQIDIINNKVTILSCIDELFKNDDNERASILIFACLNIINNRDFGVNILNFIKNIDKIGNFEIKELYNHIDNDRDFTCFYILPFLSQKHDLMEEAQRQMLEKFKEIDEEFYLENDKSKKYEKDFYVRLYLIFSSLINGGEEISKFSFELETILQMLEKYTERYKEHVNTSIIEIYNLFGELESQENSSYNEFKFYNKEVFQENYLKSLLSNTDEIIEQIIDKYYINYTVRSKQVQEKLEHQMSTFAKYFLSNNNTGRYSVTTKHKDFDKCVNIFSDYLSCFSRNEIFDVLELAHKCSRAGLDVVQLLIDESKVMDCDKYTKYVKIVAIQKLYLRAIESSKNLSPKDLSLFFKLLATRYELRYNGDKNEPLHLNCLKDNFNNDIPSIINFLTSDILELSHKTNYLKDFYSIKNSDFSCFIENFSSLLCDFEENFDSVDKKTPLKLNKDTIKKLLAKAYDDYISIINNSKEKGKEIEKVNDNINFILLKISEINNVYNNAVSFNDKTRQSIMLNLFGKILLSIDNFSIKNITKLLKAIPSQKLAVDNDILNKYSYISEHLDEYENNDIKDAYEDVTKLYDISNGEKYLNSGFSNAELMKIGKQLEKQKNKNDDIINVLNLRRIDIVKNIKNEILRNNGNIFSEFITKVDNLLFKIANNSAELIDNIYNKNKSSHDLLKNLNKKYVGELPIETLFRDESLALFTSDNKEIEENAKKTVQYLNDLTAIYSNNPEFVDKAISEYEEYVNSDKEIDFEKKMNFVVAFCIKHIKDQNKVLHHEQLIAVILRNIKLIQENKEKEENRKFCLLPTGSGKTLTILFDLYLASIKKKTPFAITTNNLLVNEMIDAAEQNSLYKGHIFYLNEKQELIEKTTNRKIPINEILDVLKNKKNVFFSSYKDFSFWYQKLLLNGGEFGLRIAKYLKKNCHLALDELDSIADAKTSNKISISSSSEQLTFDIANQVQKMYDKCINNSIEPNEYLKDIFEEGFNDEQCVLRDILELFDVEKVGDLNVSKKDLLSKAITACCIANRMKEGKEYAVDTNIKTGVSVYYPISGGEPNKTGAKYKTDIDLALKIKLNQHEGYFFDDIRKQTKVVSEASNFRIFDYVDSVFGVSGTIRGADEIWKQAGFTIDNIKPKDVKNIRYINLDNSQTKVEKDGEYSNNYLDFIFLFSAMQNAVEDSVKEKLPDLISNFINSDDSVTGFKKLIEYKSKETVKKIFETYNNFLEEKDYFLTFMEDSNELESFSKRLKINIEKFLTYCEQNGNLIINKPEIVILDKKSQLIDDYSVKQKLENNPNCFVFALPDRARGFNFPKSPKLIVTNVLDRQTDGQILGRTGRNGRRGTVIKAYAIKENVENSIKEEELEEEEFDINGLMDKKSNNIISDFRHKKNYFDIIAEVSEKTSIFLNIITRNLDAEHTNEVYNNAYKVIGLFNEMIADKWASFEKPKEPNSFNEKYFKKVAIFKNDVLNDLKQSVFVTIYNKCAYFRKGDNKELKEIIFDLDYEYKQIFGTEEEKLDRDNKIEDYEVENKDKEYLEEEKKEKEYFEKKQKKKSSFKDDVFFTLNFDDDEKTFNKQDILNLSNAEKKFFTALGCLEMYGYDVKEYDVDDEKELKKFGYNKDIIVGRKKILKDDYEERDVAIIRSNVFDNELVKDKLLTLSPDALLIIVDDDWIKIYQNKYVNKSQSCIEIDEDVSRYYNSSLSIDYLIRNFTEKNKIPFDSQEILELFEKKYKDNFSQKNSNLIKAFKNVKDSFDEDYIQDLNLRSLSYIKNGILKAFDNKSLAIECIQQEGYKEEELQDKEKFDSNYQNFLNKLNDIRDFDLDIKDQENKNILDEENTLLGILEKKIVSILKTVEDLKKQIEECNELFYEQRLDLISTCNDVISKENLLNQICRSMQVIALSAVKQLSLDNFEKIDNILKNVNNIDEAERKIKEIRANNNIGDEFATTVNESTSENENKLKKSLYNEHNKIINNINDAQDKIDRIKFYKQELKLVQDYKLSFIFEDFSSTESTIALAEELKNGLEKYNSFIKHIENEKILDNRQKEQLKSDFIDSHIDNAISLLFSPSNINKIINEFTVNYNSKEKKYKLFEDSEELENLLFNNIIDVYKKRFGGIIKNDGGDLTSMIKSIYNVEEDDFEDYEKRDEILKKYKDDIDGFKDDVKNMLLSYEIKKNKDKSQDKIVDNSSLPVTVYNILGKMFEKLCDNYNMNLDIHKNVKNDIINTIVSVFHFFKNVKGAHDDFKKNLAEILQKYIPNFEEVVGSNFQINSKTMSEINNELNDLDTQTLKKIQKLLSVAVSEDMSRLKNISRSKKITATDVNVIVKFFIILCTFGLIFCTKKGRKMFGNKKIIGKNIELSSDIKPKEYFIKNSKEEKRINDNLSNVDIKNNDVTVVNINSEEKKANGKQVMNIVRDSLNTNKLTQERG